ncbi:SDR family oxidoreductase [Novosphingobium sp. ZN18A2]|uniref:SDR family NAD(P)-dependent oxidoreductase n=1 Tax=Novosphingobium sp. ZN18A2 TaxID=3079861 RepID=UPI0030D179B3
MELGLQDKVIVVAGASRGIGLGIVEACLAEGARVALAARGADALRDVHERLAEKHGADRLWSMAGDMRETQAIETLLDRVEAEFGPVWGGVANVGLFPCPAGYDVDDETWAGGFAQNLDSSYRLARGLMRRMEPREEGAILFISSIAGLASLGTPLTYGTSKAAMNHLSGELARTAGPMGIRVNTIAPGNIIFPGGDWEARSTGNRADAWWRWIRREVPMQRFGTPEEIGNAAAWLLSAKASFVTGTVLPVDGGQTR